jgi:hypothetical protein
MKKLFLLVTGIYLLTLISFKKPGNNNFSFSEVIKEDPSKIKDLLAFADSINRNRIQKDKIHKDDKHDKDDLDKFRKKKGNEGFVLPQSTYPVIKIAMLDMMELIDPDMTSAHVTDADSLIFYLGTYKDGGNWLTRYKERNGKANQNVQFSDIKGRPAFLIGEERTSPSSRLATYYDIQRICPPPTSGGCE